MIFGFVAQSSGTSPAPMTDAQWTEWSFKTFGPVVTLLVVFILGLIRRWWVLGWVYLEKVDEAKEWKAVARQSTPIAGRALDVATKVTEGTR
jgi:hypothetical protein